MHVMQRRQDSFSSHFPVATSGSTGQEKPPFPLNFLSSQHLLDKLGHRIRHRLALRTPRVLRVPRTHRGLVLHAILVSVRRTTLSYFNVLFAALIGYLVIDRHKLVLDPVVDDDRQCRA